MTHSSGPWAYFISASSKYVIKASGKAFASVYFTKGNQQKAEANARLMAEAPELLEALVRLADFKHFPTSKNPQYAEALSIANVAIAKAKGE